MTLKGQIEVRHISEGHNLETLADTAKFIINDGYEVIYGLSFGDIFFDLESPIWPNLLLMMDRKSYPFICYY